MCDWNNNGKYDMQDAFINYHIHKSISEGEKSDWNSDDTGSLITVVGVILLVFGILMIFV